MDQGHRKKMEKKNPSAGTGTKIEFPRPGALN